MRILANENFPGEAVRALQLEGHDVSWIRMDSPGSSDRYVLSRAQAENRVIITFDKDFGELAFRFGLPATCGIILFRIAPASPAQVTRVAVAALAQRIDWVGHFAVIEEGRIRLTPLPT